MKNLTLPSNELLSAVLGEDCITIDVVCNTLYYKVSYAKDIILELNIYELMHMMEEWLLNSKKYIKFTETTQTFKIEVSLVDFEAFTDSKCELLPFKDKFEVTLKACEWLLKEKQK